MKKINVKFVGFWKGFDYHDQHIYRLLCKNFDVIVTEDADYVICSVFGKPYLYCDNSNAIRIMYVGENYLPDLNLVDYAICNYPIKMLDRCFYFPFFIDEFGHCEDLENKDRNYTKDILKEKVYFANFICSHDSENNIRGDFFKKLSKYKRVESPGTYLNNMSHGFTVKWDDDSKLQFQKKCKFTLCFESTKHEGFITEKLTDAFYADTIPVYYGSDTVKDIFNDRAYINCSDFDSFGDVIDKIIELDTNDELYISMLREPIFKKERFVSEKLKELQEYLFYIFNQPLDNAHRRSKVYIPRAHEKFLFEAREKDVDSIRIAIKSIFKVFIKRGTQVVMKLKFIIKKYLFVNI